MSGASAAGPVADVAIRDLQSLRERLEADLMRVLLRLDTEAGEDSLVRRQGQTASAVYRQIVSRLEAVGQQVISVAGTRALQAVEAVTGEPPATLSVQVREELDLIMDRAAEDVTSVFREASGDIRESAQAGIVSGGSLADLIAQVADRVQTSFLRAQAAVDAAIMAVGRRAVMAAAAEMVDTLDLVYVYVGPRDDKNRDFCRRWVGKATRHPERLDNGQGLPVPDYCGGYNCRHSWAPTPRDIAIAEGIDIEG